MMNTALYVVFALILLAAAWGGYKRGLVLSVANLAAIAAALYLACLLSAARSMKPSSSSCPAAAASWFPASETAATRRSVETTFSGSGPYPTASPRLMILPAPHRCASDRTADSAIMLAWTSDRMA